MVVRLRLVAALSLGVSLLARGVCGIETVPGAAADATVPAHVKRAEQVEARHREYRDRLERLRRQLGTDLERKAPDLYAKLEAAPGPVPHGYGILPKITPELTGPAPKVASTSYSWSRTERLIAADSARLDKLEAAVRDAAGLGEDRRRRQWEQAVSEYTALATSGKLIDSLAKYNRLWQAEIHRLRPAYDRATVLHDAVVERQEILEAQRAEGTVAPARRERAEALDREIRASTSRLVRPNFLRVEQPSSHEWVIRVPVTTDIEDDAWLQAFRAAVEDTWRIRDGADEFRVVLDIERVSPAALYGGASPPARGEHIDQMAHLARFPEGRAILTTAASITHVHTRWSINIGPHDITGRVLSHEMGHILGFVDGYFRGYRDRGPEGFEVLEVITDPTDIMSAPGFGRAQRHHFETLLKNLGAGGSWQTAPAS